MNILAIADNYITKEMMENGLALFKDKGHNIIIREWKHSDIKSLQHDNLIIEQQGANAIKIPDEITDGIDDIELIIVQFAPIGKDVIKKISKLKWVGVLRGGIENIDSVACKEKNIEILNTPGRNARAVAEFTVGMILSEIRNIGRSHDALKNGVFRKLYSNGDFIPELCNKTIGIIGFGEIGYLVYKFLSSFGCKFLIYEPYQEKLSVNEEKTELEKLLKESDIVSIHMRLTEKTRNMIDYNELSLMKKNAYFINTARSGLVNQASLVKILSENKIMGAAIDVFDIEPIPENDPILKLDNITMTSHIAGSTFDAFVNSPILFAKRFFDKFI